ncbi:MAG: hypothetical protein M0010_00780, partial [Actinomycetota bacterium]|nr:hypothetical protein [Actinomycetota bacterium]
EAAAARGARVTLVTSSALEPPAGVEVVHVESAADMHAAIAAAAPGADVVVMAAAVADFRPKAPVAQKLHGLPELVLEPTPDILAGLAEARRPGQVLVGFAIPSHWEPRPRTWSTGHGGSWSERGWTSSW